MSGDLLEVGSLVMLRDDAEEVHASRVEECRPGLLTVAKPVGIPAALPYRVGTAIDVLWTQPSGVRVIPTELIATRSEGRVLLWDLGQRGESWVEQRREFVRVPTFGRVSLRPVVSAADGAVTIYDGALAGSSVLQGYLVDLSEASVNCAIWSADADPQLQPGSPIEAEFTVRGETFIRSGMVHGLRRSGQDGDVLAVVRFEQTDGEAKALRRVVFATQVDMRSTWRRVTAEGGA